VTSIDKTDALAALGWDPAFAAAFAPYAGEMMPARVGAEREVDGAVGA
jgi:hypothetical protein